MLQVRRLLLDSGLAADTGVLSASFAVIALVLVYILGHPPYYQIAILIMAKLYSNSMIAALNSRMKVMSNSPSGSPPSWNESVHVIDPLQVELSQELAFFMDNSVGTLEERA